MPALPHDGFAGVSRRDFLAMWLLTALLLGPALAAVYAVGRWLGPGIGPRWYDGLVQGVLIPPVVFALVTLSRWIRRRRRPAG
jgi:hypothetical protein